MHQKLFNHSLPNFLLCFKVIKNVSIYSYATLILLRTLVICVITRWIAKIEFAIGRLLNSAFFLELETEQRISTKKLLSNNYKL